MAKLTIVFGFLLIITGVIGFALTGATHPTALIPSLIGAILAVCGFLANTQDTKRRMMFMHVAVTVGLLGGLMTIKGAIDVFRLAHNVDLPNPIAIEEKAATCLLCFLFVAFCIRSFIEARRGRVA